MKSLEKNVTHIELDRISFDINNPRGEKEHQIIADPEFDKLVLSITKYGILEPIIVKKDEKDVGYILIDGERRLRAANKVNEDSKGKQQKEVPALVAKDDMDGRVLAYQVHMLRKNWNKAAETKSIKNIIEDIKKGNPDITDSELVKKLKEITAHKDHEITILLKLLKYDDDIIGKVISDELNMSYLVQIESSFINPLKREFPEIVKKFKEEKIRRMLIQKALDQLLGNTRFLMDYFKDLFADKRKPAIGKLLMQFLSDKNRNIEDVYNEYKNNFKSSKSRRRPNKKSRKAQNQSSATDERFRYKKISVSSKQQNSIQDIERKIRGIAANITSEESEYISEALYCLKKYCFKAATLMIWATGVSRILKLISKNITDFNTITDVMMKNPKSFYRHFAKNFQKSITTIDDLRENANDMHLLCYLAYKQTISVPEFKKLKSNYDRRNDCAHPTAIRLSVNEIIVIFENVYDLLLNNKKI